MKAWDELFAEHGVTIETTVRRRLRPMEPPVEADLDAVERELGVRLPASYRRFCLEVGPGSCDRTISILTPHLGDSGSLGRQVEFLRTQLGWLRENALPFAPEFRPQSVISFACTEDGTHFAWRVDEPTTGDEYAIYAFGDRHDGTGGIVAWIQRLAGTFPEFVFDCGFGEGLITHGVYGKWGEDGPPKPVFNRFVDKRRTS